MMPKEAIGPRKEIEEDMGIRQHAGKPHDREPAQRIQQPASRRRHALAAEADALQLRVPSAQLAHEVGAVQIAARLAGADEDSHGFPA